MVQRGEDTPGKDTAPKSDALSHVLIVRFSAMGDVAMTVPVVYDVCRAYPHIHFTMLTKASMRGIFVNPPSNLTVRAEDLSQYEGPQGMWRLYRSINSERRIDAVADLHDVLRSRMLRLIAGMHGARVAHIDKGRASKHRLTRRRRKVMVPLPTSSQRYHTVMELLGLPAPATFNSIFGNEHAPAQLYATVTAPKPEGAIWVGIAPFAAHEGKIYPPEQMFRVAEQLHGKGLRLFFFGGGEKERVILSQWVERLPGSTSLAEKRYGFAAELALQSHLDAMVTMDSGNMHLASLVGVPTVTVWGATHPYCGFTAKGQRPELTIQTDLPCRPCSVFGNTPCRFGDYRCLASIAPSTIVERVLSLLPNHTSPSR